MKTKIFSYRMINILAGFTLLSATLAVLSMYSASATEMADKKAKSDTYVPTTPVSDQHKSIAAIDIALEESRVALDDLEANLQHTPRRIDRASLKVAKKRLLGTIKALEWQRRNMLENNSKLNAMKASVDQKRTYVEAKRLAIEQEVVGKIVEKKEELGAVRQNLLTELEQTREVIAVEIQQLQTTINEYQSNRNNMRLKALREAELAVSEMEQRHLSAIDATEAELKKVREKLEHKLKEQAALDDRFKLYSGSLNN